MATFGYLDAMLDSAFDVGANPSLSATNEVSTLPVTNLQQEHCHPTVFKTTADSTVISRDCDASVIRRLLVIPNFSGTGSTTVSIDASTSSQGGTDVLNGFTPPTLKVSTKYKLLVADLGADYTAQYWDITIQDTSLSELIMGRMALLKKLDVSINIGFPYGVQPIPMTTLDRRRGAQISRYNRLTYYSANTYKRLTFPWGPGLTETEAWDTIVGEFAHKVGQGSDIFFCQDLTASNWDLQALWGTVTRMPAMTTPAYGAYQGDFEVEEAL